ncbi:MAG: dicarboxylate/amino acid:cation symporter [Lewinellaceae bacterium]|nr:dicarboxylate/amino acid:cation symporter [Lewinellaceae bacterium]
MNWNNLKSSLTFWILMGLVVGAFLGWAVPDFAANLDILGKIFLQLIKTLVAPLLFATLVVGIAGHGDSTSLGRLGAKSFGYFIAVTSLALVFGLLAINLSKAGDDRRIVRENAEKLAPKAASVKKDWKDVAAPMVMGHTEKIIAEYESAPDSLRPGILKSGIDSLQATFSTAKAIADRPPKHDWKYIIAHIFPENIAKSVAENQVLQVVVFSILFGLGINMAGGRHRRMMVSFCESLTAVMFKFTTLVMYVAPLGVLGAMASAVSAMGLDVFIPMAKLVLTLYGALIAFVVIVFGLIVVVMRINVRKFWNAVQSPVTIAFSTASSEAALGPAMEKLEAYGIPRRIVSFVLPTGMSFNLDGSTLYLSCAAIFVAQATDHPIATSISGQLTLLAVLLITSKGVAGVARASVIVLMGTIGQFGIQEWPIYLILGVDVLMDMVRTGVNMLGNCLATVVIAKWEGEFED